MRRDLRELETLRLIRPGDPRMVAHIPADKRPEVYDLALERTISEEEPEKARKRPAKQSDRTCTSARTPTSTRTCMSGATRTSTSGRGRTYTSY